MKAIFNALFDFVKREPVRTVYIITCALTLAAAFGVHLLPIQTAAILDLVQAILGEAARSQVTPVVSLPAIPESGIKPAPPSL